MKKILIGINILIGIAVLFLLWKSTTGRLKAQRFIDPLRVTLSKNIAGLGLYLSPKDNFGKCVHRKRTCTTEFWR